MSTVTEQTQETETSNDNWKAGVIGGIAGSFAMGVAVLAMNAATLAVAIPSLYGLAPPPNPVVGMVVHLFHGTVLGVVFVAVLSAIDLDSTGSIVGAGLAWGVVTWVALAALLMPVWLGTVGSPASPPFPNFAVPSLLWHLIYGLVLGGVYVATRDRL
jgi:hypothetical protein